MKPELTWVKTKDHEYKLSAGPFIVAEVYHWAPKVLDRDKPYVAQSLLPGLDIRKELRFATVEEAKTLAERVTSHWFRSVHEGKTISDESV